MRLRILAMLIPALCVTTAVDATDLTKIERKLRSEPTYNSNAPRYCLLVFGPTAEKRVWLVLDGNELHVDLNRNRILGESGETFTSSPSTYPRFNIEQVIDTDRKDVTNKLRLYNYSSGMRIRFYGRQQQYVGFGKETRPQFGRTPADAPVIHFDGPLTLQRYSDKVTLRPNPASKSYRKNSLRLMVGTPGLGTGTFAAYHCRCRNDRGDLMATFRYPTTSAAETEIVEKVPLKTYG